MNHTRFFEHWNIAENPFRAEEARHDSVFARVDSVTLHPDFEKILGDLQRPSTSIVFGEKGSGKTALRMQIEKTIAAHNASRSDQRVLLVPYDDWNPTLDRLHARIGSDDPLASLKKMRLVDHMDGVLSAAVTRVVDDLLNDNPRAQHDLAQNASKRLRQMDPGAKGDLLALQAVYDASPAAPVRTVRLRAMTRPPFDGSSALWTLLAWMGWLLPAAVVGLFFLVEGDRTNTAWLYAFLGTLLVWALLLSKKYVWDRFVLRRLAGRVRKQTRVLPGSTESLARSLSLVPKMARDPATLPTTGADDTRYAMFARLRRILSPLGVGSVIVVVDRVDEPTLVNGDADRMRAIVWPMLNNKFLQLERTGFKLLMPIELRHALFRESSAFFQEARLDKSNLIERLQWTGAMLYDLCNARLQACLREGAKPISLRDIFDDDVGRQDIVDALDQMRQPRDAFKMLYQCVQEHCSNVTEDHPAWRIPKLTLDQVRKQQAERVQQLWHGVRPA
ncbi:MAG: hypothetical protein ACTS27_04460 [Phycisphaerales bacterium]